MAYKPTFGANDFKHEPEGHGLSSSSYRKSAKHKALKKKMLSVSVKRPIGHTITDHKGRVLKHSDN